MSIHICGPSMDTWLGVPPPTRPRCSNGHRERYMDYRKRIGTAGGFRCMKCRAEITWQENIDAPHNAWYRERKASLPERLAEERRILAELDVSRET